MLKRFKFILAACTLLALGSSAIAASISHPDGEGGCGAADYDDDNYQFSLLTSFAVPAMRDGESVTVYGQTYNGNTGQSTYAYAEFSCSGGVISTNTHYDYSVIWYLR